MAEISKADWKLFLEKIGDWLEAYMERLVRQYIKLLNSDKLASDKFWALDKRIRQDKKNPGVQIELNKGNAYWDRPIPANDQPDGPVSLNADIHVIVPRHIEVAASLQKSSREGRTPDRGALTCLI